MTRWLPSHSPRYMTSCTQFPFSSFKRILPKLWFPSRSFSLQFSGSFVGPSAIHLKALIS